MLDKLSPATRHLALLALAAVLSFLATNINMLGLPEGVKAAAGPALAWLIAWVTPLTKQYGAGSVVPGEVDPVEDFDPATTDPGMITEDH
jgi:hypothetical protein